MIESTEDVDLARLVVSPEPSPAELAAIVAVMRSRRARAASRMTVEPEVQVRSRWEAVARREAVSGQWAAGSKSHDRAANWEHSSYRHS